VRLFLVTLWENDLKGCMSSIVSAGEGGGKAKSLDRVRQAIRLKHYRVKGFTSRGFMG
jgi:hypothetical protein